MSATAWITASIFGVLLGWGVSKSPADRRTGVWSTVTLCVMGVVTWLFGPVPGSDHAMAAVGMTLSGATASTVAWLSMRRRPTA